MSYNTVCHLHKMQVTLPIMDVMKILQQKNNLIKALENEIHGRNQLEVVVISKKHQNNIQHRHLEEKVPPFLYLT